MSDKHKRRVVRLLCMQIDAHVDGDTRVSDKILDQTEIFLRLVEMVVAIQPLSIILDSTDKWRRRT